MIWRRLLYQSYRAVSSARYWVSRRFTRAGWLVLGGLALTAALGFDPELSVGYQAFALLGCLLAVSVASAVFFRGRFAVHRSLPRFGSVGQPLVYRLVLLNQTARAQAGLEVLENLADPRLTLAEFCDKLKPANGSRSFRLSQPLPSQRAAVLRAQPLPRLAPHSEADVRMELLPLKRGALRFSGVMVARPDPFNLFRAWIKVPLGQSVLILPRRYLLPPLALPGTMKYQPGGVALAGSVGESEEFVSLRDYRHGDPLRHIHWKSWAKTDHPIVKEFQDEFFVRHALVLDTFAAADDGEVFEEAVSIAASFACTLSTQDSLLDLLFVGPEAFCFTAGRGLAHTDQMLEILASVRACRDQPFTRLQNLVLEHVADVSGCVCVFVAWDGPRQELVGRLRALGIPLLVLVVTPPGAAGGLDPGPLSDRRECWHALEAGRVAEGLQKLC